MSKYPQPQVSTGYSPKEAAHLLGLTGKSVRRAIRKGNLEAKKVSGRWYISPKAFSAFEASRQKATEEAESET